MIVIHIIATVCCFIVIVVSLYEKRKGYAANWWILIIGWTIAWFLHLGDLVNALK
jgi:hypothetical protein